MAEVDNVDHIFQGDIDRWNCIHIDSQTQVKDTVTDEDFLQRLQASLKEWEKEGKLRGVWVKISKLHANLIPSCLEAGLNIHHAKKDYFMFRRWISKDPEIWPGYANQFLGCAGFVVNDKQQVLVIEERWAQKKHWKLPGGHAEPGEEIGDAAHREVLEETGIESDFQGIICFRHQHNYQFGCSDFYVICLMRPRHQDIKVGQDEISRCMWMDIDEFLDHPNVIDVNKYFAKCYLKTKNLGGQFIQPWPVMSFRKDCHHLVYSACRHD